MTTIKVLGTGCATCKRLLVDVKEMVTKNNWQAQLEYVSDISTIMSYGVISTPALMVNDTVLMTGHPGAAKVEQILKVQMESTVAKEIDPATASAKSKQGALFVDVREKSEIETVAYDVPNILYIPLGELELRFAEIPTDQDVIMVCQGGGRSLNAVYSFMSHGYVNTVNMKQGIIGWMENGFPVKKGTSFDENNISCCDTVDGGCGSCCTPTEFISINQL